MPADSSSSFASSTLSPESNVTILPAMARLSTLQAAPTLPEVVNIDVSVASGPRPILPGVDQLFMFVTEQCD